MFRVKVCGLTSIDDARLAVAAGADAIGLNFYSQSKRYCAPEVAKTIVAALPGSVCKVGVFVNATPLEIRVAVAELKLDLVQLHGDEPPQQLRELRPLPMMKAFRVGSDLTAVSNYLGACHTLRCLPRMLLLDAARPGEYGGTGATLDWPAISLARKHLREVPLVLAGGLNPSNVGEAIAAARPWAVDVASGVESSPGKKSESLMREFVAAALAALSKAAARR